MESNQEQIGLSVVVIGRNEGGRLSRCFDSIETMESAGMRVERIYVDSASTDGSPDAAEARKYRVIRLRDGRMNAARARNAGWRAAQGTFILFLDGDTILHPRFVNEALPHFASHQVAVVWGHRREIQPPTSLYNRVLDLDWIYPAGETAFCGGDAVMRRAVLEECDGYDETLSAGEEPEMCQRLRKRGYTILHIDRPMTEHDLAIHRFDQYWTRAVRSGQAYAEVSTRFDHDGFWKEDSRRNFTYGVLYGGGAVATLSALMATHSIWPVLFPLAILVALSLRTSVRYSDRSNSALTAVLYGFHSHLQHIPILWGQLQYFLRSRMGRSLNAFQYK